MIKALHYIGLSVIAVIILAAAALYSLPFATPYLQRHHHGFEVWVSNLMHQPVRVGAIKISRNGIDPEIEFDHVAVLNDAGNKTAIVINKLYVGLDLVDSLLQWRIEPKLLLLSGIKVSLKRAKDGSITVVGMTSGANNRFSDIAIWLLTQGSVKLQHVYLKWSDAKGGKLTIPDLSLELNNGIFDHKLSGTSKRFNFIVNFHGDPLHHKKLSANGYLKIRNLELQHSKIDGSFWFSWKNQRLQKLQSKFILHRSDVSLIGNVMLQHRDKDWVLHGNYRNIKFNYPKLFRQSIVIDNMQAVVTWRHHRDGWHINASNIALENADLNAHGEMKLRVPTKGSAIITDTTAAFKLNNISHAALYYPAAVMKKILVAWLDNAITKGKSISGTMFYHHGKININSQLSDITLRYNPKWPELNHINGKMLFTNNSMNITANAESLSTPIKNIKATITNLKKPLLHINALFNWHTTVKLKLFLPLGDTPGVAHVNIIIPKLKKLHLNVIFGDNKIKFINLNYDTILHGKINILRQKNFWQFSSKDLRYREQLLHQAELDVVPQQDEMRIKNLNINTKLFKLNATGEWHYHNKQHSALYGILYSNNIGKLLYQCGKSKNLVGGDGKATFTLRWPGAIYQPDFNHMSGNLLLDFKYGRVINLSKKTEAEIGLGRMLNLLSLQSLPRRLTLNFSDLTKKGYNFDDMKGDLRLLDGNIYTNDSYFDGTVAHIAVAGRIGLRAKDYDLMLTMIPNVTSSLPILVALAGGPVAGVVAWAADELFKHTLQRSTAYRYKVTGSWQHPHVVKLLEHKIPRSSRGMTASDEESV